MASNPPTPTKFSVPQLLGNVAGTYLAESAQAGNLSWTDRKMKQSVRAGLANASWQFGFLNTSVAKFLASAGIKDSVAVQAGYNSMAIFLMQMMMPGEKLGLGPAVIDGTISAYVGDQLATTKFLGSL